MSEVEWLKEFGDRLVWLMNYTWTSQAELSKVLGVSQSTVSRYMRGLQMPDIDTIILMAQTMNYSVDKLIDFGEDIY